MFNNAPEDYRCPICAAIQGREDEDTWIKQVDIFYRDDLVMGLITSKFVKGNEGHVLIVPLRHFENIYDMPPECGARVFEVAKRVAIALKTMRECDGVTVMQNNEPAGDQHAFHYHMHVVPRFSGDRFHENLMSDRKSEPEERIPYADDLRRYFGNNESS